MRRRTSACRTTRSTGPTAGSRTCPTCSCAAKSTTPGPTRRTLAFGRAPRSSPRHHERLMRARYDGNADWYDRTFGRYGELHREGSSSAHLVALLGEGTGRVAGAVVRADAGFAPDRPAAASRTLSVAQGSATRSTIANRHPNRTIANGSPVTEAGTSHVA